MVLSLLSACIVFLSPLSACTVLGMGRDHLLQIPNLSILLNHLLVSFYVNPSHAAHEIYLSKALVLLVSTYFVFKKASERKVSRTICQQLSPTVANTL